MGSTRDVFTNNKESPFETEALSLKYHRNRSNKNNYNNKTRNKLQSYWVSQTQPDHSRVNNWIIQIHLFLTRKNWEIENNNPDKQNCQSSKWPLVTVNSDNKDSNTTSHSNYSKTSLFNILWTQRKLSYQYHWNFEWVSVNENDRLKTFINLLLTNKVYSYCTKNLQRNLKYSAIATCS